MDVRRAVGWLGQTMITLGILILLFVAYQLWGTNIAEARSQRDLKAQFRTVLERVPPDPSQVLPPAPEGEAVAIIKMPKIDIEKAVLEGVGVDLLKKGPGHYPDTPMPGQPGNAAIAGHRTTYGAPFSEMDKMQPGDKVIVSTQQGTFEYETLKVEEVAPSKVEVLDPTPDNRLTLTTCHPRYSASKRLILTAALKGTAAEPSPRVTKRRESIDEGLSGDPAARGPSVAWGAAAGVVYLGTYLASRRWKRWPAYLVGGPVLLVVLFFFFENFARLLPANY